MNPVLIGLPSKGRLLEQTMAFFADCGLAVSSESGRRGYVARMAGRADIEVRLLSAGDIAGALRDGAVHAGVTGEDLLRELGDGFSQVAMVLALGFGRADLVTAVPAAWLDVTTMADLDEVGESLRARTGRRLRVATKYVRQTQAFFAAQGVDDYRIVESLGATEGAPAAGIADAIVDITTTGATLAANHLKPLADGLILRSQAQLAVSRAAPWCDDRRRALAGVLDQIEARLAGKELKLVRASVGRATPTALAAIAARAGGRPAGAGEAEVAYYVPAAQAAQVCAEAAAAGAGATGIYAADFVFSPDRVLSQRFEAALTATGT